MTSAIEPEVEQKRGGHIVISNIYSLNSLCAVIRGIRRNMMLVERRFSLLVDLLGFVLFLFLNIIFLLFSNSHFHFTFRFCYTHGILYILDIWCVSSVWSLRPVSPWLKSNNLLMTCNYSFVMINIVLWSLYFSVLLFWRTLLTSCTYTFGNLVLRSD